MKKIKKNLKIINKQKIIQIFKINITNLKICQIKKME